MTDNETKKKIAELQKLLCSIDLSGNLSTGIIMQISRELDSLILEYYLNQKIPLHKQDVEARGRF